MKVSPLTFRVCAQYFLFLAGSIRKEEEEEEEALTAIFTFRKKDSPPPFSATVGEKGEREEEAERNNPCWHSLRLSLFSLRAIVWEGGGRGKKLAKGEN